MEEQVAFTDIFKKIEQVSHKPVPPVQEIWREIEPGVFQSRLTNRKLSKVQFLRYQDSKGGTLRFVIEILRRFGEDYPNQPK